MAKESSFLCLLPGEVVLVYRQLYVHISSAVPRHARLGESLLCVHEAPGLCIIF